jgi:hypothetical protein
MRKTKQAIKVNDSSSLESLMQETYNDACNQIIDAQKTINEMTIASEPEDVNDYTNIANQRTNALKIKDSAIKIKLELAKLQNEILKHSNDGDTTTKERSGGSATTDDFSTVRAMLEKAKEAKKAVNTYKLD